MWLNFGFRKHSLTQTLCAHILKHVPGPGRISILPQNTHIREITLRLSQPFLLLSFSCRLPNHPQNHTVWTARAVCADGLSGAKGLGGKLAWLWLVGWFWLWGSSRLAERALSGMPRPPHPPPSSPSWSGRGESGERAGLLVESPLSPLPPSLRARPPSPRLFGPRRRQPPASALPKICRH